MPSFLAPPEIITDQYSVQPIYNLIAGWLSDFPLAAAILGYIVLITSGIYLNIVMISNDLISKNSLVPAFTYIVLMSIYPENLTLTPILISTLPLILMLRIVFSMYELTDTLKASLSIGLAISIVTLIYFSGIFLIPFIFIVLIVLRIASWRDWIIPFIGFILPYLYLWAFYFVTDQTSLVFSVYAEYFSRSFHLEIDTSYTYLLIEGFIVLFLLIPSMLKISASLNSFNIVTRKRLNIISWFFFFTVIIAFSGGEPSGNYLYYFSGSMLISHFLDTKKRSFRNEIIMVILVAGIILNHFISLYA